VAAILGVSVQTLQEWRQAGHIDQGRLFGFFFLFYIINCWRVPTALQKAHDIVYLSVTVIK
jgi:hypothetical protein